ncbi:MAG: hypothetical protein NVS3B2_08280 [Ramlibacter sp.]
MTTVRRRCVFYVSGFDPKGAAFYYALYRQQAQLQSALNGMQIDVGPRQRLPGGNSFWDIRATTARGQVETHYEFMRWDDVVRAHWPKNELQLWRKIVTTTLLYLRTGALWKMFQLSWPIALAAFMPFMLLCGLAVGLPVAVAVTHWAVLALTGFEAAAWACSALAAVALLGLGHLLDRRYNLSWMMRSFAFTARQARGQAPELEQRLDAQAQRLVQQAQAGGFDEVLVVGHSSGSIMASAIVARALRQAPQLGTAQSRPISLMTLGQCTPLLALLPQARLVREELATLGQAGPLEWIDFSAPPDGCCFALVDPLASCGVAPAPDRPKLLSPRFAEMFDQASYQALRRDKLHMHFQYLRAGQKPAAYDYFLITAGDQTLAERFVGTPTVPGYEALRLFNRK